MKTRMDLLKLGSLILIMCWLGGCVQTRPVPGYARAGDHIILGLGGIHRNTNSAAVLKADDLAITITDSSSTAYDLKATNIFKSYPDYNAAMNTLALDGTVTNLGLNITPFDGAWFALVPLTVIGDLNSALPLAVGPATVSISSPQLTNTTETGEGDLSSIPIEIIPGISAPDFDYLQQFVGYRGTNTNFLISPDDLSGVDAVGGALLKVDYFDDTFFKDGIEPMVVPSNHNPYVQLSYNVVSNGNGTGSVYVTILNPAGFRTAATATSNSSLLADLTVKLIYFSDGNAATAKTVFSVDSGSSYYVDPEGAVIAGLSPTFTHALDL